MSLKRQTLWSMAPLGLITCLNIVSVPLFYHYLGADLYALWFYVQTLSGSFGFMDLGLGTAVGRYLGVALGANDRDALKSYWATGNATVIPLLCLMAGFYVMVGVVFGPRWFNVSADHQKLLRWSFAVGGLSIFLAYYNLFWNVLSQAHLDFKFLSLVRIGITLGGLIPSLLLAKLTGNPLVLIAWGVVVAVIQLFVFIVHARKSYDLGLEFSHASLSRLKEMAGYTGKTFATILINSLFGSIDRLIVGRLAPPVSFADYSISSNIGGRLSAFSMAAAGPVFNNTSRTAGDTPAAAKIYNEAFQFLIGWYTLAVVWISVWHEPVARLWLGPAAGTRVGTLLPPLVLAYALTSISIISSSQLASLNRVGRQAMFHLTSGLLTIPAVYLGWRLDGLQGLAVGFLISRLPLFLQDLYLIWSIKAGGWLALRTWLMIAAQALVALLFLSLRDRFASLPLLVLGLAALHGLLISGWLLLRLRK